MKMQLPIFTRDSQTVSALLQERKKSERFWFLFLFITTLCLVPFLVIGGITMGFAVVLVLTGIPFLIIMVVRWPALGLFLCLGCALTIDQQPLAILNNQPSIYIFYWPPAMEGLPDRPIGFFLLFVLVVYAIHQLLRRQKLMQGGPMLIPYLFFLLCVVWGVVHGLSSGGNLKILVNEVRSFWYLFLGYVVAFNIFRSKMQVRTVFWFIIICAGIKALEGSYIYFFVLHGDLSGNREIMSHEESFFWITVLLLIVMFSLHSRSKPQLFTALALMPFIGISLIANNRRAGFVALIIGIMVAWLLIFLASPQKRRLLLFILISCSLLGGGYIAAFSQSNNAFGAPARSVVSVFKPDPQDVSSNIYRDIENYDLEYTVKQNPLGLGFGRPFLQPLTLPDISSLDPVYLYIPHNTIYWIWMRLGAPGYLALWFLFGSIVVRGCIISRQLKDKTLQLMAIYVVAVAVMEVIVAYADYQLSFYRNVLYIGMLTGILMKLPIIDAKEEKTTNESARADIKSSYS